MKALRYFADVIWSAFLLIAALIVGAIDEHDRRTGQGDYAP